MTPMSMRVLLLGMATAAICLLAVACGDDSGDDALASPQATATASGSPTAEPATPSPNPPTEYRVAFINLDAPLTLDTNNQEADQTFDDRLDIVINELKSFNPDLVGFN